MSRRHTLNRRGVRTDPCYTHMQGGGGLFAWKGVIPHAPTAGPSYPLPPRPRHLTVSLRCAITTRCSTPAGSASPHQCNRTLPPPLLLFSTPGDLPQGPWEQVSACQTVPDWQKHDFRWVIEAPRLSLPLWSGSSWLCWHGICHGIWMAPLSSAASLVNPYSDGSTKPSCWEALPPQATQLHAARALRAAPWVWRRSSRLLHAPCTLREDSVPGYPTPHTPGAAHPVFRPLGGRRTPPGSGNGMEAATSATSGTTLHTATAGLSYHTLDQEESPSLTYLFHSLHIKLSSILPLGGKYIN